MDAGLVQGGLVAPVHMHRGARTNIGMSEHEAMVRDACVDDLLHPLHSARAFSCTRPIRALHDSEGAMVAGLRRTEAPARLTRKG